MATTTYDPDVVETVFAALREYGSGRKACAALGMPQTTFRRILSAAGEVVAKAQAEDPRPAEDDADASARRRRQVPLSENERKFHSHWTASDCITHLREMAEAHPDQVISRNFFRVHSDISESTWNRYFGTFAEFKKQAQITLSRHAHRLERSIAKHASTSKMRDLNVEKRNWEDRYRRPDSARWQTALIFSDVHDIHCDPFYRRTLLDTAVRAQPERVVINGDLFDLPEFSKYNQDPREFDLVGRIRWVHEFLGELREAVPDAQIDLTEGNHEFRLLRHLSEQTPALMVVLADLHGMTVSQLLGLDRFEVNLIARADLGAFTERDIKQELGKNYITLWDSILFGHFPEMRSMGMPGGHGHHHKHIVFPDYSPVYGPYEWHQMGCGHKRQAVYCAAEKWGLGYMLAHVDTQRQRSQFEYVDVSHEHAVIGGRFYTRSVDEPVSDLVGKT